MTRKIIGGVKDSNGIFMPAPPELKAAAKSALEPVKVESPSTDPDSIDDLLKRGIRVIYNLMRVIEGEVLGGNPDRETIQNLKDIMTMLKDLKKEEKDLLSELSDEELSKYVHVE